ncbi:MAG TPA: ATP phosphoribosyltransferase, partial [Chthoniobacterales bacterium]
MSQNILTIGLPSGSLLDATLDLFAKAGFAISGSKRSYRPSVDDPEIEVRLLRAQEISRYVEHGFLDCGITGKDWVAENDSKVETLVELPYSKATARPTRWVLVVPEDSPIRTIED